MLRQRNDARLAMPIERPVCPMRVRNERRIDLARLSQNFARLVRPKRTKAAHSAALQGSIVFVASCSIRFAAPLIDHMMRKQR
jgi:hypothetical protein